MSLAEQSRFFLKNEILQLYVLTNLAYGTAKSELNFALSIVLIGEQKGREEYVRSAL